MPGKKFTLISSEELHQLGFFSIGAVGGGPFGRYFSLNAKDYHKNGDVWNDEQLKNFFIAGYLAGCIHLFTGYHEDRKTVDRKLLDNSVSKVKIVYDAFCNARALFSFSDDEDYNKIAEALIKCVQADKQLLSLGIRFLRDKVKLEKKLDQKDKLPEGEERQTLVKTIIQDEDNLTRLQCDVVTRVAQLICKLETAVQVLELDSSENLDDVLNKISQINLGDNSKKKVSQASFFRSATVDMLFKKPYSDSEINAIWDSISQNVFGLLDHVKNSSTEISKKINLLQNAVADGNQGLEAELRKSLDSLIDERNALSQKLGEDIFVQMTKMEECLSDSKQTGVNDILVKLAELKKCINSGVYEHFNWQAWEIHNINARIKSACDSIKAILDCNYNAEVGLPLPGRM